MKKILLSLLILIPLSGFSFNLIDTVEATARHSSSQSFAKEYIKKKYNMDIEIGSLRNENLGVYYEWNAYTVNEPKYHFYITVSYKDDGVPYVSSESLGGNIMMDKGNAFIQKQVIDKYFSSSSIFTNAFCDKCSWDTDPSTWQFTRAPITKVTIYNTPKTAENLAKAIQMSKELYNFLYDLSSSHRVGNVQIDLFSVGKEEYLKESKLNKALKSPSYWAQTGINGCSNIKKYDTELCEEKLNSFEPIIDETSIDPYLYVSFTTNERTYLKQTELYPEVKELLKEEK